MSYFFISYQRNQKEFALDLKYRIENSDAGLLAWIDDYIPLGAEWKKVIDTEITNSLGVIVIVSVDALTSQYVTYEWSFARGLGKPVIPVVLERPDPANPHHPKFHPKLDDLNYGDFTNVSKRPWKQLINELQRIKTQRHIPQAVLLAETGLDSSDPKVRYACVQTLKEFEHPSAIEALARAIQRPQPDVSLEAGFALAQKSRHLDERAIPGIERALYRSDTRQRGLQALTAMDTPGAVACLARAFQRAVVENDDHLGVDLMGAMAQLKDISAIPELRKMLQSKGTKDIGIVDALGNFRDPQALSELIEFLKVDTIGPQTQARVMAALGKIGHPDAALPIVAIATQYQAAYYHEHKLAFEAALEALENIGGEVAVQALEQVYQTANTMNSRNAIQQTLENVRKKLHATE